jgi:hypothetical protein
MNVYVTTSDWYNPLIPAFCHLFRRHWSAEQEVVFLGYTPPAEALPDNASFVSLGPPEQFGNEKPEWSPGRRGWPMNEPFPTPLWTDSLRPFFETLPEDLFVLLQIDYFLHQPVRRGIVKELERRFERAGVAKIDLSRDRTHYPNDLYSDEDGLRLIVTRQDAPYRSSLQAAIWRREYFLEYLVPGRSPWDFEELGMLEHMNDGRLILGVADREDPPVKYLNVYAQGSVRWPVVRQRMPAELLSELLDHGLMGPWWNGWGEGPDWLAA